MNKEVNNMGRIYDMFISKYNYTDFHELNLDWLIAAIKQMEYEIENFVSINAVKYADPIEWDITRSYEKNTIVIDPTTGTAYISAHPVPRGIDISRTEYWNVIFDLSRFITLAAQNFADSYEPYYTATATVHTYRNKWVVWNSTLYQALSDIDIGDAYVENGNIKQRTVEYFFNLLASGLSQEIQDRQDADAQIVLDLTDLINSKIGIAAQARADADAQIVLDMTDLITSKVGIEAQTRADADTALDTRVTALENSSMTNAENLYNFGGYNLVKKAFSVNASAMQGGCFNRLTNEIIYFADGDLIRAKEDGTVITQVTPTIDCHFNDMTINTKTNKLIICGSGGVPAFTGLAILDPSTLAYEETILSTLYYYGVAYDSENDTYACISDNDGKCHVFDATTLEEVNVFDIPFLIDGNTPVRQGCFAKNGTVTIVTSPFYNENRLYTYSTITGKLINTSAYQWDLYEPEVVDYTNCGVVFAYLVQGKVTIDYMSNVAKLEPTSTIYVDSTVSDNGFGTSGMPYKQLEYAARYAKNFKHVDVVIQSNLTGEAAYFDGVDVRISGNDKICNLDADPDFSVTFTNCQVNITYFNSVKRIRFVNSHGVVAFCKFSNITGTNIYAVGISNASNRHMHNCTFDYCTMCVRANWGGILSF